MMEMYAGARASEEENMYKYDRYSSGIVVKGKKGKGSRILVIKPTKTIFFKPSHLATSFEDMPHQQQPGPKAPPLANSNTTVVQKQA